MATEKYPQQNVNMPMDESAVQAARDRMAPTSRMPPNVAPGIAGTPGGPKEGGSLREVRGGEWIDDRKFVLDGPASPSSDTPPEIVKRDTKAVPGSYDPAKAYSVMLGKPVVYAGRMLSPAKVYTMQGAACTAITTKGSDIIVAASEVGDVPASLPSPPSEQKAKSKAKA